ncbi:MAG: hypothetical protein K9H25_01015 [Rhodospirillum sp.]|nr:hypothetical protein [Rhodospirillum sp.]MCF8488025.1 hypothetical protein [Rhodospirillum sp.]MCF8500292.1 hypothetical protein [Rhodospirillum sp.]
MITAASAPWSPVRVRADIVTLLAETPPGGPPLVIVTPPGLVAAAGPGWLPALLDGLPRDRLLPLADCGGDAGFALESLILGVGVLAPEVVEAARPRLAAIGAAMGLPVLFERAPRRGPWTAAGS